MQRQEFSFRPDTIYESGLSTAEELSELSGRGVGMDAVKSFLEAEGGKIEVKTESGKGTIFELSLPINRLKKAA
ncbi:MAG: ATP-binding protein [Oligoflexales bacterium]